MIVYTNGCLQWRIQDLRKGVSKFVEKAHVAAA